MALHGEDPFHRDALARPAQDLADADGKRVAVVQEIRNRRLAGEPVGGSVQLDDRVRVGPVVDVLAEPAALELPALQPPAPEPAVCPGGQRDCRRAPSRPVGMQDRSFALLELNELRPKLRLELRVRSSAAKCAPPLVVDPHELGERDRPGLTRRERLLLEAVVCGCLSWMDGGIGHLDLAFELPDRRTTDCGLGSRLRPFRRFRKEARMRPLRWPAMRIVVGADDEGEVADAVVDELRARGHHVTVLEREQWPEVARRVGEAVVSGEADQGMVFCWTGTGTAMAANKLPGVRAALAWDPWIAEGARRWNDANVLVMSLKRTSPETAREIVDAWLAVERPDADEAENIARLAELEQR